MWQVKWWICRRSEACRREPNIFFSDLHGEYDGELQSVQTNGKKFSGKNLLDKMDEIVNRAYFSSEHTEEKEFARDFLWYLWCGSKSPLYGKDKMAFFERFYKLFVIDGGISKACQKATGIAGYTLIYDAHSMSLAEHKPFIPGKSNQTPTIQLVEKLESRANISDTDKGVKILEKISDLRELLKAYKSGEIKEEIKER